MLPTKGQPFSQKKGRAWRSPQDRHLRPWGRPGHGVHRRAAIFVHGEGRAWRSPQDSYLRPRERPGRGFPTRQSQFFVILLLPFALKPSCLFSCACRNKGSFKSRAAGGCDFLLFLTSSPFFHFPEISDGVIPNRRASFCLELPPQ